MNAPFFGLDIDGSGATWHVARIEGRERLNAPFWFRVHATRLSPDGDASSYESSLDELLSKNAVLTIAHEAGERRIPAVLAEIARVEAHYELLLVPRAALAQDRVDYRVYLDLDSVGIAKEVWGRHAVRVESRVTGVVRKRAQCVQDFESDLAFLGRVLAEDGITWFPAYDEPDLVILADDARGFGNAEGMPVVEGAGLVGRRSLYLARASRRLVPDKVTLRDYRFEKPAVDIECFAGRETGDLEVYEFPAQGRDLAQIRLDERRAMERLLVGESSARDLSAGMLVKLDGDLAAVEGEHDVPEWLLLEVAHEGLASVADGGFGEDDRARRSYRARIVAVPKRAKYRPERSAGRVAPGVQTATTTGPPGMEIDTEQYGRVHALLRWDRVHPRDDKASAWWRTLQPATSGGFMLPRVNWETLVIFSGGSHDTPLVLGRMYNGEAPPPLLLPGNKATSAFGSSTTPGGGTKNLVSMDDAAGSELLAFESSKDWNERTENDKVTRVAGNETDSVGKDRKVIVGQVHHVAITGAETHTIGVNRTVNVDANMSITAESESVAIGSMRTIKTKGDWGTDCATLTRTVAASRTEIALEHQTRQVTGAASVVVGGTWSVAGGTQAAVSVGGESSEEVGGPKKIVADEKYTLAVKGDLTQSFASRTVSAAGGHDEGYGGKATIEIDGAAAIKGEDVIVVADSKLTIKASGVTIEMTPGEVKIKGQFVGSVDALDQGEESYA
jgi:type VI secretion system secreted protein VgrG